MNARYRVLIACGALGLLAAGMFIDRRVQSFCDSLLHGGYVSIHTPNVSPGYILAALYIGDVNYAASGEVELMDRMGNIVHSWHTPYQVLYSILEDNGDLYVTMTPPINPAAYPGGGTTGEIAKLDWKGNILWHYEDQSMTHDFDVLPDGDVAYTRWEAAPQSFADGVTGGMRTATSTIWTDGIVVVNQSKQIVWEWHMYEHLDPTKYPLGPLTPQSDWAHVNSIRYTSNNPITHTPAFLISVRHISTLFLIDAKSGAVIWQSPKNATSLQHDATLLDNGDVLVFDNGLFRQQGRPYLWSRVVEIDPRANKVVWQYKGGTSGGEEAQFVSSIMGGAQRLPNGDTFITLSTEDKMLEIGQTGNVVWEYQNDNLTDDGRQRIIFKGRVYNPKGTVWSSYLYPNPFSILLCNGRA